MSFNGVNRELSNARVSWFYNWWYQTVSPLQAPGFFPVTHMHHCEAVTSNLLTSHCI